MTSVNKQKHLTSEERNIIRRGIENASTKAVIASTLKKGKSTIGKEIKLHRKRSYKCKLPLEYANYKTCKYGWNCTLKCCDYRPFKCTRRDRSPGACNGCSNMSACRFNKYQYNPEVAQFTYRETLIETRKGINTTVSDIKVLGLKIKPLIDQGLSIYHILQNNPDISLSEKTIYTYSEDNVFKDAGVNISNIDLHRKIGRKMSKKLSRVFFS